MCVHDRSHFCPRRSSTTKFSGQSQNDFSSTTMLESPIAFERRSILKVEKLPTKFPDTLVEEKTYSEIRSREIQRGNKGRPVCIHHLFTYINIYIYTYIYAYVYIAV